MSDLRGTVVVITGASSGIGRATALECAARGASVVVAARRSEPLDELVRECRSAGGDALAVSVDVTDADAVDALAASAVDAFGRIDAWVNNAGVYLVGLFEDTPRAAFERVVDVNLMGVVHGSRAALAEFKRNGQGVLVNVSSSIGGLAAPYVSAYAAAKWGVRGFSYSLAQELRDEPRIHVCVVRPASIDTPIFRHGGNYSGRKMKALTPTYPPELAARIVADLLTDPKRDVIVGRAGKLLALAHALSPRMTDSVFGPRAESDQFTDEPQAPGPGNVHEPRSEWTSASGGWPTGSSGGRRILAGAGAAAALAAATSLVVRERRKSR